MENSDRLFLNGLHQIKVNKKKKSHKIGSNIQLNDIESFNDNFPIHTRKFHSNIPTNENYSSSQNKRYNKILNKEISHSLSNSQKDLNFRKINIKDNKYNISDRPYLTNHSNRENDEEDKAKKLVIYRSETQYPLSYRNNNMNINVERNSNNNGNYRQNVKDVNLRYLRYSTLSPKYGHKQRIDKNKKIRIYNNSHNNLLYESDNDYFKKKHYDNMREFSNATFNNIGYNFYQPIHGQINNNTNFYYNNNENGYFENINFTENNNFANHHQNIPYISKTIHTIDGYNNQEYLQLFNRNKINNNPNFNKNMKFINENSNRMTESNYNTIKNEKDLINIYKGKLIKIFVKFMLNFYTSHLKINFNDFITRLRGINNFNKRYQKSKYKSGNYYDIKNKYYKYKDNISNDTRDKNPSLFKSISSYNDYPSINKFKKKSKKLNSNIANDDNYLFTTKDEETIKRSSCNIYIPPKKKIGNNNILSETRPKKNIFNEIKINKNLFINNPNEYANNFHNYNQYASNKNNYKKNSFNTFMTLTKQRPKLFLVNNKQDRNYNTILGNIKEESNKNIQPIFRKKIMSKDSKDKKENNNNNNIYFKSKEKISKNKNKDKNENIKDEKTRHTTNNILKNNYDSTGFNCSNNNEINHNINNITILSNDFNNYYLDDKPMNMIYLKSSHTDNDKESLVSPKSIRNILNKNSIDKQMNEISNEIKNLTKIKTKDKRIFININYVLFNSKNKRNPNNKAFKYNNNKLLVCITHSLHFASKSKRIENGINNFSPKYSYKRSLDSVNKNLNKYKKKSKLENGLIRFNNLINGKLKKYQKSLFNGLKKIKFYYLFKKIIKNLQKNMLKKYFKIYKKSIYHKLNQPLKSTQRKRKLHFSFKEIITFDNCTSPDNYSYNLDYIRKKKNNFNFMMASNDKSENNFINPKKINELQGKEKLKFLIKQTYKNNNRKRKSNGDNSEDKNIANTSIEDERKNNINIIIPSLKSSELNHLNYNLAMKRQNTLYSRKIISP